jgi:hypothetical protein
LFAGKKMEQPPAVVWLLIAFLLIPFTILQNVILLAAWFAPVFLLRFARSPGHARRCFTKWKTS